MKFKALPVTSLEDVTIDFEQLETVSILNSTPASFLQAANNLNDLASRTTALTNLGIKGGTVSFTFSASSTSGAQTVTHGLGTAPTAIILQSVAASNFLASNITAASTTTFTANAFVTAATTVSGTFAFYWLALK